MQQRRGSVSSNGSANVRPSELQRKNSSGSMTDRTFREPSPNRGNSSILQLDDAPPVPALPREYASPPPLPAKSIRRPASVEPPERIGSPNPRLGGRGVSLDRGPGMLPLRPDRRSKQRVARVDNSSESTRSQTRDSVNFSRPMSPPNSPPTSPSYTKPPTSLHDQSASIALAAAVRAPATAGSDTENIQYTIQNAANRPVKKNKKVVSKGNAEGSHFPKSAAPVAATPAPNLQRETPSNHHRQLSLDTNLQNSDAREAQPPNRKKKKSVTATYDPPRSAYGSDSDTQSEHGSSSDLPRTYTTRAARLLAKQPSVVREDRAAEEKEEKTTVRRPTKEVTPNGDAATGYQPASSETSEIYQQHNRSTSEPVASSKNTSANSGNVPATASMAGTEKPSEDKKSAGQQPFSPARAAHFSTQLVLQTPDVMKHQPPSRSVSPAKSALKHSPSSRGPSPLGALPGSWTGRNGRAASEASDTASAVSDDGTKHRPRKKSVKVSFDEGSVLVGRAASPPPSPDSPIIMSPQDKRTEGRWSIADRNRREDVSASNLDISNVMQPTPTLPSFGGIRAKENQNPPQPMRPKVAQDSSASLPTRVGSSTDEIIGRIFAQDIEGKGQSSTLSTPYGHNDILTPEVTATEGGHNHSEGNISYADVPFPGASGLSAVPDRPLILDTASAKASNREIPSSVSAGRVPSIAILPATPGVDDHNEAQNTWLDMPGGFPPSTDSLHRDQSSATPVVEHHPTDPTPAQAGIAEPETTPLASKHEIGVPAVGHVAEVFRTQIGSQAADEDTDSSIYSDAAEDLSDLEGDGFGSINAIVESPARDKPGDLKATSPAGVGAKSSAKRSANKNQTRPGALSRNESELSEPGVEEGWDRAQQYWSRLSPGRKAQLERAAAPGSLGGLPDETKPRAVTSKPPSKKKASQDQPPQSPILEHPPLPPWPDKQYRKEMAKSTPPVASATKQSKRNSQPEGPRDAHMLNSVRNEGAPSLPRPFSRNSTQSPDAPQPRSALRKKTRPTSAATLDEYDLPKTGTAVSHSRAASAGPAFQNVATVAASPAAPKLRRIKSNDSDSSSSFKKSRPRATDNGRYTMKRSMRGGSVDERPQSMLAVQNGSINGRSLSPSVSNTRRPLSSAGPSLRTSLRGSIDADVESRTKSPSRFGFGRAAKPPKKNTNPKWSSRFADSSDEEDSRRARSSRFVDSSDDEDMTPVRGIPRRVDEGDSTELEDSPAETPPPSKPVSKNPPNAPKQAEGSTLVGSGHSPYNSISSGAGAVGTGSQARIWAEKDKKKRSFFGGLGKKKVDDSRVGKSEVDSPAHRDTPLERPKAERLLSNGSVAGGSPAAGAVVAAAAAAAGTTPTSSPKSPRLQRRHTPKRFASDSWPLPEIPLKMPGADERPNTSDGTGLGLALGGDGRENGNGVGNGATRPELGGRRSTDLGEAISRAGANGILPAGAASAPGNSKSTSKKKRFPMLRKALGLHD